MLSLVLNCASRRIPIGIILVLVGAALLGWLGSLFGNLPVWVARPLDVLSAFTTVFLGIFIEAAPFLLLGSIASGIVEIFFGPAEFSPWAPKNRVLSVLRGSLLGMFFPVCECGVVPLSHRMAQKGLPVPAAVAFVLGAPLLNPIVIASTLSAFGFGMIVSWPQAVSFSGNTWVRVRGRLQTASIANQTLPGIKAQFVDPIPEPDQPYLFP